MRIVLDTNVLLSACLKPDGLEALLVDLAISGEVSACVTEEVLAEYKDVLFREKFRTVRARATSLIERIELKAVRVAGAVPSAAASDEDDNRFLECACGAEADWLITGNLRHYPPRSGVTAIVNARQFIDTHAMLSPTFAGR